MAIAVFQRASFNDNFYLLGNIQVQRGIKKGRRSIALPAFGKDMCNRNCFV